jgi:hypothetical protein
VSNPSPLTLDQTLALGNPLDVDEARKAARMIAEQRRAAIREYERHMRAAAEKNHAYRLAKAKAYLTVEGSDAAARKAAVEAEIADQEQAALIADGMVKAAQEWLRELEGERSLLKSLVDWSSRVDPDAQREPAAASVRAVA